MDVIIGRKNTSNIGDFSNIQPNVQLVLKDVALEDFSQVFILMTEIVDGMEAIQAQNCLNNIENLNEIKPTYRNYLNVLTESKQEILDDIEENIEILRIKGYGG